uniref:MICOS complex subunit MIC13 n=1 Tax=Rhabditophanes sp. KR3021 TaxID=114890 RepID=A0AC35TQJ7_9BILA
MATPVVAAVAKEAIKVPFLKTIVPRTKEYWIKLGQDYKTSIIDCVKDSKKSPIKAGIIIGLFGVSGYAINTNPTTDDFRNDMAIRRHALSLVPPSILNPTTMTAINERENLWNQNKLKFYDFLFLTLIVKCKYDKTLYIAESRDVNLKDYIWNEILDNVIEVAAFGKYFYLDQAMKEYDVDDSQFPNGLVPSIF